MTTEIVDAETIQRLVKVMVNGGGNATFYCGTIGWKGAAEILRQFNHENQRRINAKNSARLQSDMLAHEFEDGSVLTFVTTVVNGEMKICLIDGQHRLSSLVATKSSSYFVLSFEVVESESQLNDRYDSFDALSRFGLKEYFMAIYENLSAYPHVASSIDKALRLLSTDFYNKSEGVWKSLDLDKKAAVLDYWLNEIEILCETLNDRESKIVTQKINVDRVMGHAENLAIAIMTTRQFPDEAPEFWRGVVQEEGEHANTPTRYLCRELNMAKYNAKMGKAAVACFPDRINRIAFSFSRHLAGKDITKFSGETGRTISDQWRRELPILDEILSS